MLNDTSGCGVINPLPSFTLGISYRANGNLDLPSFPGSLWRGALGPALRDIACFTRWRPCSECVLLKDCLYPAFFEDLPVLKNGKRSPPRPFVLHVDWVGGSRRCVAGGRLGFSLTLFSEVVRKRIAYLVAALARLGERGIGRDRTPLTLESVDVLTPGGGHLERIYKDGLLRLAPKPWAWPDDFVLDPGCVHNVQIQLLTPLIIKRYAQHLDKGPPFGELARALLRRRHDLIDAFAGGGPEVDEALRQNATLVLRMSEQVSMEEDRTYWQPLERYSGRRKQKQSQSGLMGSIGYSMVPAPLVELLRFGVLTHAGGGTAMGMGAFSLRVAGLIQQGPPFWVELGEGGW
jgi:hypothetical protein